jgi:uncharacterized protein YktA (UPF0223 family)
MPRLPKTKLDERIKRDYIREAQNFKFKKAYAKYAEIVIRKNTKRLVNKDYEEIAALLYKNVDRIKTLRLRRMIEDVGEIRNNCDNALQIALINAGMNENYIKDLLKKAENVAKTSSDYIKIAEFTKESLNISNKTRTTQTISQDIDISDKLDQAKSDKITIKETRTTVE